MDSVPALGDDPEDLIYSGLTGVLYFESATGHEAAVIDGEDDSAKERLVGSVKRAIDKDAV